MPSTFAAAATQVTSTFGLHDWLGLTVVGAIVSTVGAIFGILLKEFFFARSLEKWKQRQTLEQVYGRYRAPLLLAARELAYRLSEIAEHHPPVFLRAVVLDSNPDRLLRNSVDDPYFQRYKLLSTFYRLTALLGWIELYRQEITNLDSGDSAHSRRLEAAVELIRCDLAEGELNNATDWPEWRDAMIFREELRAIGEAMFEARGTTRTVMGYGSFCAKLGNDTEPRNPLTVAFVSLSNFFLDLEVDGRDFRHTRLRRLLIHTVDLMTLLERETVAWKLVEHRDKLSIKLTKEEEERDRVAGSPKLSGALERPGV